MSDSTPIFPIPSAAEMLTGAKNIKPLQHDAAALRKFVAQFEDIVLSPEAAENLSNLAHHLQQEKWATEHDAAHQALLKAYAMSQNPSKELVSDANTIKAFVDSQLPNASSLKIMNTELQTLLGPVKTYVEGWNESLRGWTRLTPRRLNPAEGVAGVTLAQFRAKTPRPTQVFTRNVSPTPSTRAAGAASHVHGPNCNHNFFTPPPASGGGRHVHGPGCGHDHGPTLSSGGGGGHYHADGSYHAPRGETHLPRGKSNAGWWVAGIVAAVGVGVYLINEYGRPKKKEPAPPSGDWKDRVDAPTTAESRWL